MRVLALTHAQLNVEGLSPVSCERADSITGTWAAALGWEVDVVHTSGAKWPGIWPGGKGLKINILEAAAPDKLMLSARQLFATELKAHLSKKELLPAIGLVAGRVGKKTRTSLARRGMADPHELAVARQWGLHLARRHDIRSNKYDFIFVCVGYGDEYLLQTGHTLSEQLGTPMIVDFRDLWSDHHDPHRFTTEQKTLIRRYEKKLLASAIMISAPQKHMIKLMRQWLPQPMHLLSHSAYKDDSWPDGHVVADEFTMLYAGKLYASGPGIKMLLELLRQLSARKLHKPFRCHFFVDDTTTLERMAQEYGVAQYITAGKWISPGELWEQMRSAHLLLIPDSGVAEHYPILPTKTFQYAYTGRQLLCLLEYRNDEMQEFLQEQNAGIACTDVAEAAAWAERLSYEPTQYQALPPLRDIPRREDRAIAFGREIAQLLGGK